VSKEFAGVPAVIDASFEVREGTVHGVIGKNGAGKSVLMNMLAGVISPTSGEMTVGDTRVDTKRWSPRLAGDNGVALIPQEPPDLPFITVEDFLFLGDRTAVKGGFLQRKAIRRKVAEIDERLSLRVLPTDPMTLLPIEVQQLLAFGKAVYLEEATVILLDEITASLSGPRRESLLSQLRELSSGRSFTLISHHISEIIAACDTVTVMRDGVSVQTVPTAETGPEALAAAIVGDADVHVRVAPEARLDGAVVLRLTGVASPPLLRDVDITVHEHEVLGLAGVEGSGKDELLEVLAGQRAGKGRITLGGKDVRFRNPRGAARGGVAYLPKKREEFATIHTMSVLHNMVLPTAAKLAGPLGFVRESTLRRAGAPLVEQMQVKTPSLHADIDTLSGGNRQKVMLARLRLMTPRVFLLNEPTRGVDIATKPELLRVVREELTKHSAVIMTSESEEELLETCDRILVFLGGRIVRELTRGDAEFTVQEIYRTGQGVAAS
jgi:ABC-type sugar transport system ATPase subunit